MTRFIHNQPTRVIVEYGDTGNRGATVLLAAAIVAALAIGGASQAGRVLDGILRACLIGVGCVAVALVLVVLVFLRRAFWRYHDQRQQDAVAAQAKAREIAERAQAIAALAPVEEAVADVLAIERPGFAASPVVLSGLPVETVRVERIPRRSTP